MLSWLEKIWCACTNMAWHIADLLVLVLNGFFSALGLALGAVLGLFPALPELPGQVNATVLDWANWLVPIGGLLVTFGIYLALYVVARIYMSIVNFADRMGLGGGAGGRK